MQILFHFNEVSFIFIRVQGRRVTESHPESLFLHNDKFFTLTSHWLNKVINISIWNWKTTIESILISRLISWKSCLNNHQSSCWTKWPKVSKLLCQGSAFDLDLSDPIINWPVFTFLYENFFNNLFFYFSLDNIRSHRQCVNFYSQVMTYATILSCQRNFKVFFVKLICARYKSSLFARGINRLSRFANNEAKEIS